MKRITLLVTIPCMVFAQSKPDIIVFDEDDQIGAGYYDASYGFSSTGSQLYLLGTNDKLPIIFSASYTGSNSGFIKWTSVGGGSWGLFVASPGWQTRDASAYDSLVFYLNGPGQVVSAALPRIGLESSTNAKTATIDLATVLASGVDADTNSWQRVSISLQTFQPFGSFQLSQFKDVNFWQNQSDGVQHTLWIDNIRIVAKESVVDTTSSPKRVVTRWGDGSVVLHWDPATQSNVEGYNVYRSSTKSGVYSKLNSSLDLDPGFVDFNVVNGNTYWYFVRTVSAQVESPGSDTVSVTPTTFASDDEFLDYLELTTLDYFWYEANPKNGLIRDRNEPWAASSIAAVGFGLTSYGIGVERGWLGRPEAADRTLTTLRTLWETPQGSSASGVSGYMGWFYHFLDMNSATRTWDSELSSIDTGLLLAGIVYAREFYTLPDSAETSIRALADSILNRVDWNWMTNGQNSLTMGWFPTGSASPGFLSARWIGYNEAMILYLLGLGSSINQLPSQSWDSWT
ncbi:MAG: hypothetical protein WBD36_14540, partial [Bacteroidota bacterium]